jgi:hypothetical protein
LSDNQCKSCTDTHCTVCPNNICEECKESYFLKLGLCQLCNVDGCSQCTNSTNCKACKDGYYIHIEIECIPCPARCKSCSSIACYECDLGFFLKETSCIECNTYCNLCEESGCIVCNTIALLSQSGVCFSKSINHCSEYNSVVARGVSQATILMEINV